MQCKTSIYPHWHAMIQVLDALKAVVSKEAKVQRNIETLYQGYTELFFKSL